MSFPKYPAYKDSGVEWIGEIPAHWSLQRYKQVFAERDERSETGEEMLLSVSAYTGIAPRGEIINDGDFLSRAQSLVGYKICYPNDLVMNIMLAWNRGLGFSNYYGIVSPAYSVFKLLSGNFARFLDYLVRSDEVILYYKAFSSGVIDSRLRLYPNIFGSLYCALPPLPEQQAIASFLDRECAKIDALIAEQERLIALLAEKRQAVISHAVTKGLNPNAPMKDSGISWIGVVPEGWEVHPLKNVASVQTGIAKGKEVIEQKSVQMPYLRVANVQDGYLDLSEISRINIDRDQVEKYLLRQGDVLMNEGGDFDKLGRGAIWYGEISPCIHQNHVFAVRPKSIMSEWVSAVIGSDYAKFYFMTRSKQSTNLASISSTNLMMLPIIVPSIDDQKTIVNFLESKKSQFENLMNSANSIITLLKERRSALISAAVTGKIDVRAQSKAIAA
ncbi:restriction endonuclease subunit S [Acetobacter fallax]|uniref:Type I restriction endonuclease subunit S n=1 Tax=Acetobacter fallax TaxID=1737473 RepID=A0ABX0K6U6_9PROT|nr:restriction endonuclease subunit S [Acetobacter fallax]NHO31184.1 type I restriction endonuclease subunit S [Acetobacter fallax]NHO34741.1 type I restriction endonuclease subunit S [Acetobacter fallax]